LQADRWHELRRILVVRPDNYGDVVRAAPALRALQRVAPGKECLDIAPSEVGAAALELPACGRVDAEAA
jgi:ADP-heptose:LPS heptosyltransferase